MSGSQSHQKPGPSNSITDVDGILVGNAEDQLLKSGVTVVRCEDTSTASCHILGGAPGTRDTELLAPEYLVDGVHAICLSGGSIYGLDAVSGVQAALRKDGVGTPVGNCRIPIAPGAILFDLLNGGNKNWGLYPPYRELGYRAAIDARKSFAIGTVGAGTGATLAGLKGGLGTASQVLSNGVTVGALVAVNAMGGATFLDSGHFWAAPFEIGDEFGGFGLPPSLESKPVQLRTKFDDFPVDSSLGQNTTIAVVATDADLSKAAAKRLAMAAHDGIARAVWPAHTPFDGDLVFSVATGKSEKWLAMADMTEMCAVTASTLARSIARGVFAAKPADGDLQTTWKQKYGHLFGMGSSVTV